MPYYQLRLTFSTILKIDDCNLKDPDLSRVYQVISHLLPTVAEGTEYACADEKLNKFGEKTKRHIHFTWESEKNPPAMRARIIRFSTSAGLNIKGNTMYCLSVAQEPDDYHRWLRYCFKEKCRLKYTKCDNIEELTLLAKDERKRSVASNCANRTKQLEKMTLYDRLVVYLDKTKSTTEKTIFISICKFYVQEKKPVQPATLKGYTLTYMLSKNYISYEFFYSKQTF